MRESEHRFLYLAFLPITYSLVRDLNRPQSHAPARPRGVSCGELLMMMNAQSTVQGTPCHRDLSTLRTTISVFRLLSHA